MSAKKETTLRTLAAALLKGKKDGETKTNHIVNMAVLLMLELLTDELKQLTGKKLVSAVSEAYKSLTDAKIRSGLDKAMKQVKADNEAAKVAHKEANKGKEKSERVNYSDTEFFDECRLMTQTLSMRRNRLSTAGEKAKKEAAKKAKVEEREQELKQKFIDKGELVDPNEITTTFSEASYQELIQALAQKAIEDGHTNTVCQQLKNLLDHMTAA